MYHLGYLYFNESLLLKIIFINLVKLLNIIPYIILFFYLKLLCSVIGRSIFCKKKIAIRQQQTKHWTKINITPKYFLEYTIVIRLILTLDYRTIHYKLYCITLKHFRNFNNSACTEQPYKCPVCSFDSFPNSTLAKNWFFYFINIEFILVSHKWSQ